MIRHRRVVPGEVIQEAPLARSLGISRTPLREALGRLEGEGLLVRDTARRLTVRRFLVEDVLETIHLRRVVERETARLAAESHARDTFAAFRSRTLVAADGGLSPEAERALDDDLHRAVASASGSRVLGEVLETYRMRAVLFEIDRERKWGTLSAAEHLRLLDALIAGDADAAVTAMEAHLDAVRLRILTALTRSGRAW